MKRVVAAASVMALLMIARPAAAAEAPRDPSFLHGVGAVVHGLLFEFPLTVIDGTLTGPPIAGTVVGAIAGVPKALQKVAAGIAEMAQGFDPWGTKSSR